MESLGSLQAPLRCSEWPCARCQFSVLPLSLGHNVELHTGIEGVLMFGDENVALITSRLTTDISSVYAP